MFDTFTDRARKIIAYSQREAERLGHDYIGSEHLLLGMVEEGTGVAVTALGNLGVGPEEVRHGVEKLLGAGSGNSSRLRSPLPFTPQARHVLEVASKEARVLGHPYIGSEHVLLGLISDQACIAAKALSGLQLRLEDIRIEILGLLGVASIPHSSRHAIGSADNRYIFIIRSGTSELTPGEYKLRFEKLKIWSSLMRQQGRNPQAGALGDEMYLATPDTGKTPSPQTEPRASWFMFIDAADFSEAEKIANEHPDLQFGYSIEVRRWMTLLPSAKSQ